MIPLFNPRANKPGVQASERCRGPNLAVFHDRFHHVPMGTAIRRADESGLVLASNRRIDQALEEKWDGYLGLRKLRRCWTGTLAACEASGRELGRQIVQADKRSAIKIVFPVPPDFRGSKDVVLVAEHPNFSIVNDGGDWVVQYEGVGIVAGFPAVYRGYCSCDPVFGIPTWGEANKGAPLHAFFRNMGEATVGLIARQTRRFSESADLIFDFPWFGIPNWVVVEDPVPTLWQDVVTNPRSDAK